MTLKYLTEMMGYQLSFVVHLFPKKEQIVITHYKMFIRHDISTYTCIDMPLGVSMGILPSVV